MARAGDIIDNPITGERITFLKTAKDTNGELLRLEYLAPPHTPGPPLHIHPYSEERFELLSGTLTARRRGNEQSLETGRKLVVAPGTPHTVFAAGRNVRKAELFSTETRGKVLPLKLDLADPSGAARSLEGTSVVVACAEADGPAFAKEVMERGAHYVDISASDARLQELERLDALAKRRGVTAVLSVGLSPGLTNVLARHCVDALGDELRSLDIFAMLGLGEAHGEAAIRWIVENLDRRLEAPGATVPVGSLEDPRTTLFPGGHGRRRVYRFDFADQHVLARTLGVRRVATRLCFDSAALTRLLALMKRAGVFRALKHRWVREALVALLSRFHMGSEGFAVKVEAEGSIGERPERYSCSIRGHGNARATGIVAALVAESLFDSPHEAGVFHIEQRFEPRELLDRVEEFGITVDLPDRRLK